MFPPVYKTLRSNATVVSLVGDRIGRHGEVAQTEVRPYIVWQIVTGQPYDNLSAAPCGDFTVVQIDCYHQTDAGVEQLATSVRAALDAKLISNRVSVNRRDKDTRLYRVGLDADFITGR